MYLYYMLAEREKVHLKCTGVQYRTTGMWPKIEPCTEGLNAIFDEGLKSELLENIKFS